MKLLQRLLKPRSRSLPDARASRPSYEFRARQIEFLGEQDGLPEQELKSELSRVFAGGNFVSRAYLARVRYESMSDDSVVLALAGGAEQAGNVIGAVGRVFAAMFNSKEHLDTFFLDEEQEARLERLCAPFFVRRLVGEA